MKCPECGSEMAAYSKVKQSRWTSIGWVATRIQSLWKCKNPECGHEEKVKR